MGELTERSRSKWSQVIDSAGFRASSCWLFVYLVVLFSGHQFDSGYLEYGWQLIPWETLSTDPFRSVWYLHIQPPMWNFLLGVSAWLSPVSDGLTLQLVMLAFGLSAVWMGTNIARRFGLSRRLSIVVTLVVFLNPEVFRGVFEPTYEFPVGCLLMGLVLGVAKFRERVEPMKWFLVCSILITTVVMTRSLYHPAWAITTLVVLVLPLRKTVSMRSLLLALSIPLLVAGGWMIKNQVLFGQTTLSSWFGMNLQRAVLPVVPRADLLEMVESGDISPFAVEQPFAPYSTYAKYVDGCVPTRSHPSLSEPTRSSEDVIPNFNFECYLPVYEEALDNALTAIRKHPSDWIEGRIWSLRATMAISTAPQFSESAIMRGLNDGYSVLGLNVTGALSTSSWGTQLYGPNTTSIRIQFGYSYAALYIFVLGVGGALMKKKIRSRVGEPAALVLLVSSIAWYTIVVGAFGELGEQARFRTTIDPLVILVSVSLLVRMVAGRNHSHATSVAR